jgi:hypothetical protein
MMLIERKRSANVCERRWAIAKMSPVDLGGTYDHANDTTSYSKNKLKEKMPQVDFYIPAYSGEKHFG